MKKIIRRIICVFIFSTVILDSNAQFYSVSNDGDTFEMTTKDLPQEAKESIIWSILYGDAFVKERDFTKSIIYKSQFQVLEKEE